MPRNEWPGRRVAGTPSHWAAILIAAGTSLLAVPAQSAAPDPRLEELVEVADLSGLAASPDASKVAFRTDRASIERNSFDLEWHVLDLATNIVTRIGSGGEPIIADPGILVAEAPIWSPDGRFIYYRALDAGGVQIWRSATDGSGSERVTQEPGDVLSMELSQGGRGISYRVGPPRAEIEQAELSEYDQGILVDQHVELGQNIFRGAIINGRHATQRLTGPWFARGGLLWSRPAKERHLDFGTLAQSDTPSEAPATSAGRGSKAASPDLTAKANNGDVATARWNGADGGLTVARTRSGRRSVTCDAPLCQTGRITWLAWRPGRDEIIFAIADPAHVQSLYAWNVSGNRVRPVAASDGLMNGGRSASAPCAVTRQEAVCVTAGPASPPRLEVINLQSGTRRSPFDPNQALRSRHWPIAERLQWRSSEGRLFTAILFMPDGRTRPVPLFINYYRCEGFLRGGVGDESPFVALAASGIASACVNATTMQGAQDGVGQYRAAQGGIAALVELLADRGLIDRARIGIGGLSFGSEVAMWMVIHSNLIAAASVASPQFEPANYWFNGVRGRDNHERLREVWGLGTPEETPDQWRLLSPALNIERIRVPLLLQLPEQESRYAVELYARLSNSATPTELYAFPDEPHVKVQPRHRLAVYRRNLDWFRFWLLDEADDDPARADQYRRWRALATHFTHQRQDPPERSQSSRAARSNNLK